MNKKSAHFERIHTNGASQGSYASIFIEQKIHSKANAIEKMILKM